MDANCGKLQLDEKYSNTKDQGKTRLYKVKDPKTKDPKVQRPKDPITKQRERLIRKTKDERRKTKDERRKTKDERRKTKDERRSKTKD